MSDTAVAADTNTAATAAAAETPPGAPAKKGGKGAKASAPAKPAAESPAAAKGGETAVAATPPGEFKPEITVQGQRQAADAAEAEQKAAEEAKTGRTAGKSLDAVKAARRARVEAELAAKGGATGAEAKAAETPAAEVQPGDAAAAATKAAEEKAKVDEAATKAKADEEAAKKAAESTKAEVAVPKEKLAEFTKLNRELTAARQRVRELEAGSKDTEALAKARKLAAEGKHFDAIREAGFDLDAAVAEVMGREAEEKDTDPAVKKLRDDLKAATEKLEKLEDGQTKDRERINAELTKAQKAERSAWEERVIGQVTLAAEKFPMLSRDSSFVRAALAEAEENYPIVVKKLGRELTPAEKDNLVAWALEDHEKTHEQRARLYGVLPKEAAKPKETEKPAAAAAEAKPAASTTPTTADGAMRGVVGVSKPKAKKTWDEIKEKNRQAREAERGARR